MKKIKISCPITATMSLIGGKWKVVILWYLKDAPLRFTELKKKIPECSLKMFNDTLKELTTDGLIKREVFAEVPPKVEYSISEYGKSLLPIIVSMRQWGVQHLVKHPKYMSGNESLQEMINQIVTNEGIHVS